MPRRWFGLCVPAALLAILLAATIGAAPASGRVESGASAKASTVDVGIIYSRTGLLSAYGAEYIQGLRLGLEYATHGTNKVNGKKIVLHLADDTSVDAAKAVSAAKDFIGQGYKIIGGSTSSGIGLQVAAVAAQNKVLNISGAAASDALTGVNRYTFRAGRQSIQDVLTVRGMLGRQTGKKIVVFAQDSAFGRANVAAVKQFLGTRQNVDQILVPLSATDFTPFAERAKAEKPDLLFVAWAGTTAQAMWRALDQQRVTRTAKVATGLAERATWSFYATGVDFLSHYAATAPKNKVNNWLVKRMRRNGQAPDLFTPDGFVTALMIVRAVGKGGGSDVDKMISSLEGWKFLAPKGKQQIRKADHAMLQPMFHVRLVKKKGKPLAKLIKTFSAKQVAPPVTPFK